MLSVKGGMKNRDEFLLRKKGSNFVLKVKDCLFKEGKLRTKSEC